MEASPRLCGDPSLNDATSTLGFAPRARPPVLVLVRVAHLARLELPHRGEILPVMNILPRHPLHERRRRRRRLLHPVHARPVRRHPWSPASPRTPFNPGRRATANLPTARAPSPVRFARAIRSEPTARPPSRIDSRRTSPRRRRPARRLPRASLNPAKRRPGRRLRRGDQIRSPTDGPSTEGTPAVRVARAGSEGNVRRVRARAMDPRPARPLVRPEDADPFAFSDQSQRCPSSGGNGIRSCAKRRLAGCAEVQSQRDDAGQTRPAPILLQRCTRPARTRAPSRGRWRRSDDDRRRRVGSLPSPRRVPGANT